MSENTFWFGFWALITAVVITALVIIYQANIINNDHELRKFNACIESGGTWIPQLRGDNMCIKIK